MHQDGGFPATASRAFGLFLQFRLCFRTYPWLRRHCWQCFGTMNAGRVTANSTNALYLSEELENEPSLDVQFTSHFQISMMKDGKKTKCRYSHLPQSPTSCSEFGDTLG